MLFLRLLMNALGSSLMVWGFIVPGLLLVYAIDYLIERATGKHEVMTGAVERWKLIVIPGLLVQIWYAALASHQVRLDLEVWEQSWLYAFAVHGAAVLGLAIVVLLFDRIFRAWLEVYDSFYLTAVIAASGLVAYAIFQALPRTAQWLAELWPKALYVLGLFS